VDSYNFAIWTLEHDSMGGASVFVLGQRGADRMAQGGGAKDQNRRKSE